MTKVKVTVFLDSNGTHLHQIYTGLFLLQQEGHIDLVLQRGTDKTNGRPNRQFLAVCIEDRGASAKCIFDLQDSSKLGLPQSLEWCDVYFKRSLTPGSIAGLADNLAKKVVPFGFNYQVVESSRTFFLRRLLLELLSRPYNPFASKNGFHLSNMREYFDAVWKARPSPLLSQKVLSPYSGRLTNQVLFQCRLWDPEEISERNRADAMAVNNQRIHLIRQMKKEFGTRFVGGLQQSKYTVRVAPELLIDSNLTARRNAYIELVKQSAIVISSPGLLGSNGWKLGEYIALGKCIVSEPIVTTLPGEFLAGREYCAYDSTNECLEKLTELFENRDKVLEFSQNTANYYRSFLAPKALMMRHITTALAMPTTVIR